MISGLFLLKGHRQSIKGLFVVDRCLQVKKSLQEQNLTGARNSRMGMVATQCTCLIVLTDGVSVGLAEEASTLGQQVALCLSVVPGVSFLSLDESWKLLPVHRGHLGVFAGPLA